MLSLDQTLRPVHDCLRGGGEMGALMRAIDWRHTALGPVEGWPEAVRQAVSLCLGSRFPMIVFAGPDFAMLYNDGYAPVLGPKRLDAMGVPCRDVWPEIWHIVGPELEDALAGNANWVVDRLLPLERHGYLEECRFTSSFSQIRRDDGTPVGVFCAVTETSDRVFAERRTATLRDVASAARGATDEPEACRLAMEALSRNPADIPFAAIYRFDGDQARLAAQVGFPTGHPALPPLVGLGVPGEDVWQLAEMRTAEAPVLVEGLAARFPVLPAGDWPVAPGRALVLPLTLPGQTAPLSALVLGVTGRKALDEAHRTFLGMLADQVSAALADASAYAEERRRAEALAELDQAKTAFFSNVSHEFRTPLTLLLSPIEEMLRDGAALPAAHRGMLEMAQRNGLRLLRLVNTLLDFSRIEAGRARASYEPTDLGALTADLASTFRSLMDQAGLAFDVECAPLTEPVWVDREMWEKIVLNLLSNAFKFTLRGGVSLRLRAAGPDVELVVGDTGVGIPTAELPRLFERFHRVEGSRGRTQEGTGIGLALVRELVGLHGGTIDAASVEGEGTTFTVRLPFGQSHLPEGQRRRPDELPSTRVGATAFVEEAHRWISGSEGGLLVAGTGGAWRSPFADRPRVLLADDNADMRDYVGRLLEPYFEVEAVADGEAALAAAGRSPAELVLTDVMMPGLDGIGLLRALRQEERTAAIPVVLLSARAGAEAGIDALAAGADDYLVKPFTAQELLARVTAAIRLARLRNAAQAAVTESERRLAALFGQASVGIAQTDLEGRFLLANAALSRLLGRPAGELASLRLQDVMHADDRAAMTVHMGRLISTGEPFTLEARHAKLDGGTVWCRTSVAAVRDGEGRPASLVAVVEDVSERRRMDDRQKLLLAELNHRVKNTLATVQALSLQTLRTSGSAAAFHEAFGERLRALSEAHDLLTRREWAGAPLEDVVAATLAPYGATDRLRWRGPAVLLAPSPAVALHMAFHELATNAAKYGALSVPQGGINVAWTIAEQDLRIEWRETGGPAVSPPARRGFGSRLVERGLAHELDGTVVLDFDPAGVRCTMKFPLSGQVSPL